MGRNVLKHGCIRVVRRRSASSQTRVPPCSCCHLPTLSPVWPPAPRWPFCGIKIRVRRHGSRSVVSRAVRTKQRQQEPAPTPDGPEARKHGQRSGCPGNPGPALKRIIPEQTGAHLDHQSAQGSPGDDALFKEPVSPTVQRVCELPYRQPFHATRLRTRALQCLTVGSECRQQPSRPLSNILNGGSEHPFHGSGCAHVEKCAFLRPQDSQVGCTQHRGHCHGLGLWNAGGGTVA